MKNGDGLRAPGVDVAREWPGVLLLAGADSKTAMSSVVRPGGGRPALVGSVEEREWSDGDPRNAERRMSGDAGVLVTMDEGRDCDSSVRSVILLRRVGWGWGGGDVKEGRETKEGEPV